MAICMMGCVGSSIGLCIESVARICLLRRKNIPKEQLHDNS